ncbi:hypothetical protein D3C86_1882720 [compost metagenome]
MFVFNFTRNAPKGFITEDPTSPTWKTPDTGLRTFAAIGYLDPTATFQFTLPPS